MRFFNSGRPMLISFPAPRHKELQCPNKDLPGRHRCGTTARQSGNPFLKKECVSVTDRQAHDSRFLYPLHPDDPAGDSSAWHVVLVEPEIPPNTGAIARLCGATDSVLHLVHPLGFKTDDRHLKRAGLDYWEHVRIRHWDNLAAFLAAQPKARLHLLTTKSGRPYTAARFRPGDMLVFGRETKGLPEEILALYSDRCLTIPMCNPHIRSLNLAMCAGIVLYEAIRQRDAHSFPSGVADARTSL